MRTFAAAVLTGLASAKVLSQVDYDFARYIAEFGKSYESLEEFNLRAEIFAQTDKEIKHHNINETTSSHGHSFLSDWTVDEKAKLLGYVAEENAEEAPLFDHAGLGYPASVDWVTAGKVNPIQNQGQCGSCWAFSAVAAMESAHAIKHGKLYKLSEQNFVSCVRGGCNGGNYSTAWNYAKTNPIESESDYPYTSGRGVTGSCKYNKSKGIGGTTGYHSVGSSVDAMKTAIATQPVSVSIEADTNYFQSYKGGVLTNAAACG